MQSLSGTAMGRLVLGGTLASMDVRVAVSEMNLTARHQRVTLPRHGQEGGPHLR